MNIVKTSAATAILLMVLTLGNHCALFAPAAIAETTAPEITAKVDGVPLEISAPNHVNLPATIVFTANMPLTIYYTTNGTVPTEETTTHSNIASANATATGPTITSTEYMLITLGVDANGSLTPLLTYTFVTP